MFLRPSIATGLLIAAAVGLHPRTAVAQAMPQVTVALNIYGGAARGGGGARDPQPFIVGQPYTTYKFAGDLNRNDHSICTVGGAQSLTLDDLLSRYAHVWKVSITPLSYEGGRERMRLEWVRYKSGSGQQPVASAKLELQLDEGETRPLDMLHADAGSQCSGKSVVLDVSASIQEDQALADEVLQYELWLVHKDAQGRETRRQMSATMRQGQEYGYLFAPIRFQVTDQPGTDRRFTVAITMKGSIRGRLQPDGRIAVQLDSAARRALVVRGEPMTTGGGGGEGRKAFTVAPGEVVEIKIPAPSGWSALPAKEGGRLSGTVGIAPAGSGTAPTEAVSVADGAVRVSHAKFFEGHETSLILKVTRVQ